MKEFELKEEHIKLLQRAYISWQNCEYGAPEINPKRPYGNSDVETDIAEILEWPVEIVEIDDEGGMIIDQREAAFEIHEETLMALQIILQTRSFVPGIYVNKEKYNPKWQLKPSLIDI